MVGGRAKERESRPWASRSLGGRLREGWWVGGREGERERNRV
jgi:hypothetical protein